jgi:glutathione S-transferase
MRIRGYALPVPGRVTDYVRRVCALPAVKAWMDAALEEKDFVAFDEPYRTSR